MSKIYQDPRFQDVFTDPKFRILSKKERKFKIDKRFKKMLTDDKWKVQYTVDSRGRPIKQSSADHLEKFYDLSSDDSDSEEDNVATPTKKDSKAKKKTKGKKVEVSKSPKDTTVERNEDSKLKKKKKANEKQAETAVLEQSSKVEGKKKRGKNNESNGEKSKTSMKSVSGKKKTATSSWTVTQTESEENSDGDAQQPMSPTSGGGDIDERFILPPGAESDADESEGEAESFQEEEEDEQSDAAESESEAEKSEGEEAEEESAEEESSDDGTLDRARGIGLESSSDEDEVDSDWEVPNEIQGDLELGWAELDKDAGETDETTSRLALCNVDWDRVQARDIFMLLKSFVSQAAVLQRVTVYPSDYGLERMKEEDAKGPLELQAAKGDDDAENENMLRKHQFNRLRYYYAVAEFDSPATAKLVYDACNGTEYESTGNVMDLRFIPEDMTFDQKMRDACEGEATKYKPLLYNNSSFKQTKVNSTWEEEDPRRRDLTTRLATCKAEEIWEHMDEVEDLIAPPSSDEGDDSQGGLDDFIDFADFPAPEKPGKDAGLLELFKQAVGKLEDERRRDKDKDVDNEDTYKHGIQEDLEAAVQSKQQGGKKGKGKKLTHVQSDSEDDEDLDEMEGEAAFSDDGDMPPDLRSLGPAHQLQAEGSKKKRSRKKKKKLTAEEEAAAKQEEASLALMTMGEEDEEGGVQKKHFSLRALQKQEKEKGKKKGKKKRKRELDSEDEAGQDGKDDFRMDVEDDRFAALYSKPEYNIDPSVPQYKATAGMQQILTKKIKKRKQMLE